MRAPVAMRTPISRVRSVTFTSMMFMTPMPPTSSEIAAIEPSRIVSVFCVSVAVSRSEAMLRIWKSTVRWRASSSCSTASCVSSMRETSSTATVMLRRNRWPKRRRPPVVYGTNTTSSWSVPLGDAPRSAATPITWKSTFFSTMCLPIGSVPSGKRLSATVWPSTTTGA